MLELYHGATSVCSQKVRLVLEAKGVEWRGHMLDLNKREQFAPAYLRLNPNGVVPTLVDDGAPIIESTLINEYVDDIVPEPALKPASPLARVKMRLWTKRLDEGLHSATSVITFAAVLRHSRGRPGSPELAAYIAAIPNAKRREMIMQPILDGPRAANVAPALKLFEKTIGDMERALGEAPWLAGDSYSLADAGLTPYIKRLDMLNLSDLWAGLPRVGEWYDRVRALPNYAPAIDTYISPQLVEKYDAGGSECHDAFMAALRTDESD
ncbi:MAG TPA: glutathione S-transferase family protein [Hyphomicrobiales bacterium]|nr:glutathione S-transferase family protein [Rhodobiaceae bacterium]HXK54247.1 glutathione S-transferase family protein [Hyphomicrobiales bacterium]